MYWENHSNQSWTEKIRYFSNYENHLSENELRDAFIHLAYLYSSEFCNLKLLEEHIVRIFGEEYLENLICESNEGRTITKIEFNCGEIDDILGITLYLCKYIDTKWFNGS